MYNYHILDGIHPIPMWYRDYIDDMNGLTDRYENEYPDHVKKEDALLKLQKYLDEESA